MSETAGSVSMALSKRKKAARAAYVKRLSEPAHPGQKSILPSPTGEVARLLGWEKSVPRCENCRFVKPAMTILHRSTSSLPVVLVPPVCKRGKFYTQAASLCDHWIGHDGASLKP